MKWWADFDASHANQEAVKKWFTTNPNLLKHVDPHTALFLNHKARIAAALAGSKNEDEVANSLQTILNLIQDEKKKKISSHPKSSPSNASSEGSFETDNEDFDVNLAED